jgi:transcriptional regulator with GAF, ATPase, and Fis domain
MSSERYALPRVPAWYALADGCTAGDERALVTALSRAEVIADPLGADDAPPGDAPGVVAIARCTDAVCARVRALSAGGATRVLVVARLPAAEVAPFAWRLLAHGAADVVPWDGAPDAPAIGARIRRWAEIDHVVASPLVRDALVGASPAWRRVLRQVVEAALYTDGPVLLTGETGTGKELLARLVHTLDRRPGKGDLVLVDCTTMVPELSGSELFGHERGAFTGAVGARDGALALADRGTLFLDELGELPPAQQAELLRAVQERTYKRVGGNAWRHAAFRLVCATNRDLRAEAEAGRFRRDLYYRVAAVTCTLPPLRERPEDIVPLARHFMAQLRPGADPPALDDAVRAHLERRAYPGNVRDLRQLVTRLMYRHVGPGPVTPGDVPDDERPDPDDASPPDWQDEGFERAVRRAVALGTPLQEITRAAGELAVRVALQAEGSLPRAARKLGVTDRALQLRRAARRQQLAGPQGA